MAGDPFSELADLLAAYGVETSRESVAAMLRLYAWGGLLPARETFLIGRWWAVSGDDQVRVALSTGE